MSSYELPANASEDVLRLKIDEVQGNLQSLNISNCIVAHPAGLLSLLSGLRNLEALSCIACPLKPSDLLDLLLSSLQNVTSLEFSLVEAVNDAAKEVNKIRDVVGVRNDGKVTNIRRIYLEVAGPENLHVMFAFIQYCPYVTNIHLHFVEYARLQIGVLVFFRATRLLSGLREFATTCESRATMTPDPWPANARTRLDNHANVVFRMNPSRWNYVNLYDLAVSLDRTLPAAPVVIVAFASPDLDRCFTYAGPGRNWSCLKSMCLLYISDHLDDAFYPTVHGAHAPALRNFFARLTNIVELNVSSVHFDDDIDFTTLLRASALSRLSALSVPPCGLRQRGAVHRLAIGLRDIQDLDIRLKCEGRHTRCYHCSGELSVDPEDASLFCASSSRLTLSDVPNLASLTFLESCPVAHLRFIDISDEPRYDFGALSRAVRNSRTLRSLVVKLSHIDFNSESFESSLSPAEALERLCILSKTKLRSRKAQRIVKAMACHIPSIFYLHIHYVNIETNKETNATWIRLPEGDTGGQSFRGKPCIMCSTQTFIALIKPRCREL
ncbi:uncharacterized protein LOC119405108 [Rhipicephalus sanguineus]|uniref:Uncharacterized protein n=1 Tax=Rhipicephalus sanguineus TaxID=34632 RepID=A0A9D4PBP4_RHISA|nr:uncharacterized protein LOC119405108 [Rhipicephalus sanguineus]KAH7935799.1 hypothetical protein HPB52_013598 [Rhipicephalus sanguineus]